MSKHVAKKVQRLNNVIRMLEGNIDTLKGENENLRWTIDMNAKGTDEIRQMLENEKKNVKTEKVEVPINPVISIIDNTGSIVDITNNGDKVIIEITSKESDWV